jgi:hypothetical protein
MRREPALHDTRPDAIPKKFAGGEQSARSGPHDQDGRCVCAFTNLTRLFVECGANIADARVEVGHTVSPCWFNGHRPCGSAFAPLSGHRANAQCIVLALIVRDFHALDAPRAAACQTGVRRSAWISQGEAAEFSEAVVHRDTALRSLR